MPIPGTTRTSVTLTLAVPPLLRVAIALTSLSCGDLSVGPDLVEVGMIIHLPVYLSCFLDPLITSLSLLASLRAQVLSEIFTLRKQYDSR